MAHAQSQTQSRITSPVSPVKLKHIVGSTHPLAVPGNDKGRADAGTPMQRMILVLSRSDQQNADLQNLIAAQKKPQTTKLFHRHRSAIAPVGIVAVASMKATMYRKKPMTAPEYTPLPVRSVRANPPFHRKTQWPLPISADPTEWS